MTKYEYAVEWIALNDGAADTKKGDNDLDNLDIISSQVTVCLVADTFGKTNLKVARDVFRVRRKQGWL